MIALLELGEHLWKGAKGVEERRRIANTMAFAVIGFCASLRGEEVPLVSLKGLMTFWKETMVKGENNLKWHLVPLVDVTNSGIRVRRWGAQASAVETEGGRRGGSKGLFMGKAREQRRTSIQEFVGRCKQRTKVAPCPSASWFVGWAIKNISTISTPGRCRTVSL